ncbi:hypothetical protein ACETK8_19130 [Brevundimonas staleyi]|uniref:Uncharacterized protein n=1 Tax=Brevundimonas staleyi TaxID=74326 RepID=A0ABW0FS61_9CAUL
MTAPARRGEWIWRGGSALAALVCMGGLWIVSRQVWMGLTTGRIRGKYGWTLREDRPIMFDITVGLNVMAALIWVALGALAIWFACSRRLYED